MEVITNKIYQDIKGNNYIIKYLGISSESGKEVVIYQALYGDFLLYVKPKDTFLQEVETNKFIAYNENINISNNNINNGNHAIKNRIYKHFKGDNYLLIDIGICSESLKEVVIYQALYEDGLIYVRPKDMFLSIVDKEKYPNCKQKYRFELQEIKSLNK